MKRNSLRALLLLGFVSAQFAANSQQIKQIKQKATQENQIIYKSSPNADGWIRCHTMERDSIRRANDPSLPSLEQEEMWLQQQIAIRKNQISNGEAKQAVITIPIIFHIFTDGAGSENVSATQVQAQVDQLNLDYADLSGSSYAVSADTEIQFCLAQVDESGTPLAEPGIERITSYGQGPFSDTQFESSMKAATIWDPNDYFNVWVCNLSGGLLGYAQFPNSSGLSGLSANNGSSNTDGCVILYSTLGSVANPFPGGAPYNLGRTLTHEAGHWLGLRHVWGDGGCSVDDFCADTPKSDAANYSCPNTNSCTDAYGAPWPTANPADMVENYMDYTDDDCMNTFTGDQKTRIQTVMSVSPRRSTLGASTVCNLATNPDDVGVASVDSPTGTICAANFIPEVTVTNFGTNTVTSFTVTYNIDGSGSQNYNWTGTLTSGQSTTITLPSMTASNGAHIFNASTSSPNGNADSNNGNNAALSNFTMNPSGQMVTLEIDTDCYGEEVVWELYDSGSNLVDMGGNQNVTLPVTATQGTAGTDPGAYAAETTVTIEWCLTDGCYDFTIWDAYGDGMYGSQYSGCTTDGDYTITDASMNILASMQAANSDYGFSETVNFCLAPPCAATFSTPQTVTEQCYGDDNNVIQVNFLTGNSTGATYNIGGGAQGSNTFTGLAQGSYSITVVDGDACTSYISVNVSGPSQLSLQAQDDDISCNGETDGSIVATANGGTPDYTYDIGGAGQASGTFNGLSSGGYTVSVVDDNGCTTTSVVVDISEPSSLSASAGTISPEYFGNDGSVNLSVSGGTAPYTYAWTGAGYSSSVQDPSNMPGGTYNVTVTDANGCTTTVNNVVVPSELGLDENGNTLFTIYPNPSNGVFNVQVAEVGTINCVVTDITGRVVYQNEKVNTTFVVDLSFAANGTYMVNITTANTSYVKRVVLKK